MAKQTVERLLDDIDGTPASETVAFSIDGRDYNVDLSEQNAAKLRERIHGYVSAARRIRGPHRGVRGRRGRAVPGNKDRNAAIRQWALAEGVQLPSRGRIATAVHVAFDANDIDALYAATGLVREQEPAPKARRRTPRAVFSTSE